MRLRHTVWLELLIPWLLIDAVGLCGVDLETVDGVIGHVGIPREINQSLDVRVGSV